MKKNVTKIAGYTPYLLGCVCVWVGLATGSLQAQEVRVITLGEAIQTALENNIALKQSSNRVALSELAVQQARADFYPNLNASMSASEGYSRSFDPIMDRTEGQNSESINFRLSSQVDLFNGFNNVASLEKSKLDLAAQEKNLARTHQLLIFQTVSRYLQVLLDKEFIQTEEENLEAQRQQLALIEEFYRVGNRSIADVLQQKVTIAQAELRLLSAERSYDVSKLELLKTMGLELLMTYEVTELAIEDLTSDLIRVPPDQLLESDLPKRADVQAQQFRIVAANEQMRVARSGYWPSLSLSIGGGTDYSSRNELGNFSDQFFDFNPNASVGLSLSIPIFDRSRTKHSVAQAKVQLASERLSLEDLKQEVTFEVQQAVLDYQTALKQLEVAEAQLESSQQALKVAEERYNVGASTLVELTQSRAQYLEAINQHIQAQYNLLLGRVGIDYYQGGMDRTLSLFD